MTNALWQLFNNPFELFFQWFYFLSSGRSLHIHLAPTNNRLNHMKSLFLSQKYTFICWDLIVIEHLTPYCEPLIFLCSLQLNPATHATHKGISSLEGGKDVASCPRASVSLSVQWKGCARIPLGCCWYQQSRKWKWWSVTPTCPGASLPSEDASKALSTAAVMVPCKSRVK